MGDNMKKKYISIILSALFIISVFTGCAKSKVSSETANISTSSTAEKSNTRIITDNSGIQVTVPENIKRIADLDGAHNEILAVLGYADKIVTSGQETSPELTPWLYKVAPAMNNTEGGFKNGINTEALMSVKPDIAFLEVGDKNIDKITSVGIPVVQWKVSDFESLKKCVSVTAEALGEDAIKKGKQYNEYFDNKLNMIKNVTSKIPEEKKPKVLHIVNLSPLMVDGGNCIINDWIEAAGGINAAKSIEGKMKEVSMEQVLQWNPDIIVFGKVRVSGQSTAVQSMKKSIMNNDEWKKISAVQNGKVFANPDGIFAWDRLSAEEALQIQWAAKTFYPDLFEDLDVAKETKDFFKTFTNYDITDDEVQKILNSESLQ